MNSIRSLSNQFDRVQRQRHAHLKYTDRKNSKRRLHRALAPSRSPRRRSLPGTKLLLQELQNIAQPFRMLYWRFILAEAPARGSSGLRAAAGPF
jgi:hypothetical protein